MTRKSVFLVCIFACNFCVFTALFFLAFSRKNSMETSDSALLSGAQTQASAHTQLISAATDWQQNDFLRNLQEFPTLKVFAKITFAGSARSDWLKKLAKQGVEFPLGWKKNLRKSHAVVRITPRQVTVVQKFAFVQDVEIFVEFLASASYKLKIWLDGPQEKVSFTVSLPYGRYGHKLLSRSAQFEGIKGPMRQTDQLITAVVDTLDTRFAVFSAKMEFLVNLRELLALHIRIWGKDVSLQKYLSQVSRWPLTPKYLQTNENIKFCNYVNEFAKGVLVTDSLQKIWDNITRKLDADILYDWRKKADFFSGNLAYKDIKDMYLTCTQLSVMRVGACPERSALEVSMLRRLGIPARTVTRLFHIYAQVYVPQLGWVPTSVNARQIPLCESVGDDISYFVSWKPHHPVRIKWEGEFIPKEIIEDHAGI